MVIWRQQGASVGFIHVPVTVTLVIGGSKQYGAEFLIDTGALDAVAPSRELHRIGLKPDGVNTYELADGSLRDFAFAFARLTFMGTVVICRVLFGPDDASPLLGVMALESAGVVIDPANRRLRKRPALPLKAVSFANQDARAGFAEHDLVAGLQANSSRPSRHSDRPAVAHHARAMRAAIVPDPVVT